MNRSKDLRNLFRESIKNKHKVSSSSVNPSYCYRPSLVFKPQNDNGKKIFFYEWSDVCRTPLCFYDLDSFVLYLKCSQIDIPLYQEEAMKGMNVCYVTCYKGTKNLNIRATYQSLSSSMSEFNNRGRVSPVYAGGHWQECEGSFFG